MNTNLDQIKKEIKKLDDLYKNDLIPKKDYKEKLDYLKECASFLKHEKVYTKTK